ncbi:hypothetical protein CTAYLR_008625 [Chrysophaeum taylorii]|uniref:Nudix hydrolase domain-containing protein n=1 Tax=Chrysophaeum taylorii TaxID=2483200 RepID=A0AAD7UHM6_9STRA|nr:hypothetical protein CTAYLR_008625 [Chrysophaeum taylorii]
MRVSNVCLRLLERVGAVNDVGSSSFVPLVVDGVVGAIAERDAEAVCGTPAFRRVGGAVRLAEELQALDSTGRTAGVAEATAALRDAGIVRGWRDELVPVAPAFGAEPAFLVERAAYPLLGAKGYGVHVNGFVRDPLRLWVGRRSPTKQTWPGMLDHLVAGHVSHGLSPGETVVKEAGEEAGVEPSLARTARPAGAVSYRGADEEGRLKDDTLFVYDLELPGNFVPTPVDGEVDSFSLWDIDTVLANIEHFKPNVVLVIADFLVRHGILTPAEPGYLDLVKALRCSGECR